MGAHCPRSCQSVGRKETIVTGLHCQNLLWQQLKFACRAGRGVVHPLTKNMKGLDEAGRTLA